MKTTRRDLSWARARVAPLLLPLALPLCLLGACDKASKTVPPDPGGLPAGGAEAKVNPGQVHAPTSPAAAMPADHPAVLEGSPQHSPGADVPALPDLSKRVTGTLKLTDKTKAKVAAGDVIFLVARSYNEGGAPGQVLAVKRLTAGSWPLGFELSGSDVMIEGAALNGKVVVTARVDKDGDAMTKLPGDIEGVSKPISVPAKDVEVLLDTVRTEAAPMPPGMGGAPSGTGGMPAGHP